MSISLDTLMTLARERSRTKRHALLRGVTEMFFAVPERNAAEMALFDDVMDMVLAEVEPLARQELAERLAGLAAAPRRTLLRLADDEIEVAEPILVRSIALGDDDLEPIMLRQTQAHLFAIARRQALSARLTDILVEHGNDNVAGAVVANAGATFSDTGFSMLARRAAANDNLLDRLVMRCDLPERVATDLLPVLTASMRAKIESVSAGIADAAAGELVAEAWVMLAERLRAAATPARPLLLLVNLMERGNLLFGEAVLELADADRLVDLAALMGRKLGLYDDIVARNLFDADVRPMMLICRAAGLDLNGFSAVLRLRQRRKRVDSNPGAALKNYLTIPYDVAASVVASVRARDRG